MPNVTNYVGASGGRPVLWTSGGTNVAAFFRGAYQTQVGLASSSSEIFRAMA